MDKRMETCKRYSRRCTSTVDIEPTIYECTEVLTHKQQLYNRDKDVDKYSRSCSRQKDVATADAEGWNFCVSRRPLRQTVPPSSRPNRGMVRSRRMSCWRCLGRDFDSRGGGRLTIHTNRSLFLLHVLLPAMRCVARIRKNMTLYVSGVVRGPIVTTNARNHYQHKHTKA